MTHDNTNHASLKKLLDEMEHTGRNERNQFEERRRREAHERRVSVQSEIGVHLELKRILVFDRIAGALEGVIAMLTPHFTYAPGGAGAKEAASDFYANLPMPDREELGH